MADSKFVTPVDLNLNEIKNGVVQLLATDPAGPVNGQVWVNSTTWLLKIRLNGVTVSLGRLDQISAPTASVAMNNQKLIGLADGTAASDAATKGQVDAASAGLDPKGSVRASTTANGALASAYENGDVIDGVTLVTGDRILLKNQTTGSENGIYTVNAAGAPTRATDADTSAEVSAGMYTFVEEGTQNADTGWVLTTNNPITLGTTALTFAKFTGASTGSTVFAQTVGDGAATSFNVDHNKGTLDVLVQVVEVATGDTVTAGVTRSNTNRVVVTFTVAPTTNQYRILVIG